MQCLYIYLIFMNERGKNSFYCAMPIAQTFRKHSITTLLQSLPRFQQLPAKKIDANRQ